MLITFDQKLQGKSSQGCTFFLSGVGALRGGLGSQADVLFHHSILSQLPTQYQQIWSVPSYKWTILIYSTFDSFKHFVAIASQFIVKHTRQSTEDEAIKQNPF